MIHATEMIELEQRARAVRLTMSEVCKRAGKQRQSWFRARKRGRAEYRLIDPLWDVVHAAETERVRCGGFSD